MTAVEILDTLRRNDIQLRVAGDQLCYDAPEGAITDEVLGLLRQHKATLLALIQADTPSASPAPPPQEERPALHTGVSVLEQHPPTLITEAREFERILPALCAAPLVAVDSETTGLDPLTHRLRLVQFALPDG